MLRINVLKKLMLEFVFMPNNLLPSRMETSNTEGKIKLGGCTMDLNNPDYHCNDCRYEWQRGKRNDGYYAEE